MWSMPYLSTGVARRRSGKLCQHESSPLSVEPTMDNSTPHQAGDYEREISRTVPFHAEIQSQALDFVATLQPSPRRWLDTGCGPGTLAKRIAASFPGAQLVLADPSDAMLSLARGHNPSLPATSFVCAASADLPDLERFDVITAILCHHYGSVDDRRRSLRRCRDLLAPGGVLVTFENVRAETGAGHELQRQRWAAWQCAQGREANAVTQHLAREGVAMHPIAVSAHLSLLRELDFAWVEVVWRAYAQAGFVARAPPSHI